MRECPTCRRQYQGDLAFCPEDGSSLVAVREVETHFASPQPTASLRTSRKSSHVVLAIFLILSGGFIIAVGAVGYAIYRFRSEENIFVEPTTSPTPKSTTNHNNANATTTPEPSRSGKSGHEHPVPKQISGGVLNGKATSLPKPTYPPAARAVRASGAVSVQVLVDEQGNVVSASAASGHPLLRAAAVKAALGAKFAPKLLSGNPIKVSGVLIYDFVP